MKIQEIKLFMKSKGITQIELAEKSKIPLTTIRYIFSGRTQTPRIDTMDAIEKALGLDVEKIPNGAYTIGSSKIPLVGKVVAGKPIETSEYLEGYITIDYPHPDDYFALRVDGNSMIGARIRDGDTVIVRKQNYADNGDIVVVSVNGESTVKRYKKTGNIIYLFPENPDFEPIPVTEHDKFFIFGKVVEVRARL